MMFWYKAEPFPRWFYDSSDADIGIQLYNYRMMRILCCFGFILLASVLPIFSERHKRHTLPHSEKYGFGQPSSCWILQSQCLISITLIKWQTDYSKDRGAIYAIGNRDFPMHSVLLPQDSVCSSPEHYLKVHYERHGNLLIQPETRDTIWIEIGGVWVNPDRQTIESNTSCQMRWQWQYYAWHKIKGLFCKDKSEQ